MKMNDNSDDSDSIGTKQYQDPFTKEWYCEECFQPINDHLESCQAHQNYKKWSLGILEESERQNTCPRDPAMCTGCPQPKEGPHKFSCYVGGAKASQVILPASKSSEGKYTIQIPPGKTQKPK